MSAFSITKDNFTHEVLSATQPVLLDFWAEWCVPCRMLSPVVEQIAAEHPEIKVGKVNVDEQGELAQQFRIMGIPALLLFQNGELRATTVGAQPKQAIEAMLKLAENR